MSDRVIETMRLNPGGKTRYLAGKRDVEGKTQSYSVNIDVPKGARDLVECHSILTGDKANPTIAFDIHNKSSWLVFIDVIANDDE